MKPTSPPVLRGTRLLDQVRERIRYKHYSLRAMGGHVREMARLGASSRLGAIGKRALSGYVSLALVARLNDGY